MSKKEIPGNRQEHESSDYEEGSELSDNSSTPTQPSASIHRRRSTSTDRGDDTARVAGNPRSSSAFKIGGSIAKDQTKADELWIEKTSSSTTPFQSADAAGAYCEELMGKLEDGTKSVVDLVVLLLTSAGIVSAFTRAREKFKTFVERVHEFQGRAVKRRKGEGAAKKTTEGYKKALVDAMATMALGWVWKDKKSLSDKEQGFLVQHGVKNANDIVLCFATALKVS
jgi:hypothetical protein